MTIYQCGVIALNRLRLFRLSLPVAWLFRHAWLIEKLNNGSWAEIGGILPRTQRPDNFLVRGHFQNLHGASPILGILDGVGAPIHEHGVAVGQAFSPLNDEKFNIGHILLREFPDSFPLGIDLACETFVAGDLRCFRFSIARLTMVSVPPPTRFPSRRRRIQQPCHCPCAQREKFRCGHPHAAELGMGVFGVSRWQHNFFFNLAADSIDDHQFRRIAVLNNHHPVSANGLDGMHLKSLGGIVIPNEFFIGSHFAGAGFAGKYDVPIGKHGGVTESWSVLGPSALATFVGMSYCQATLPSRTIKMDWVFLG